MSPMMTRVGGWNVEEGEFVEQVNDDVDVPNLLIIEPCHPRVRDNRDDASLGIPTLSV